MRAFAVVQHWARLAWRALCAVARGVGSEIGRDEMVLVVALGLVGYGLWLTPWKPAAFIGPGLVLLWMALPPRKRFIVRQDAPAASRRSP
jgi:hypothetical protein